MRAMMRRRDLVKAPSVKILAADLASVTCIVRHGEESATCGLPQPRRDVCFFTVAPAALAPTGSTYMPIA